MHRADKREVARLRSDSKDCTLRRGGLGAAGASSRVPECTDPAAGPSRIPSGMMTLEVKMSRRLTWVGSSLGILALCGLSNTALGATILSDNFSTQSQFPSFPNNWTQFLGKSGDVSVASSGHLVMTDSQGGGAGIISTLSSSTFDPGTVTTTDTVHINSTSVNPIGNAIFGLIGPTTNGELAAGIDSTGNVFVVETDPAKNLNQVIVLLGKATGYAGGAIDLTLTIDPTGVAVTSTSGFNSGHKSFSSDLSGFTLNGAFGSAATPALVGASQQGQTGGSANFGSVTVATIVGAAIPEPPSLISLGIGVAGLGVVAAIRRQRRVAG